jgi:lysozyme family protein
MASFKTAYSWLLSNEDAADMHATVTDRCPEGCTLDHCFAISGINSGAFPLQYTAIANMPQADRGPLVKTFYLAHFWCILNGSSWYAQLTSDEVAKRVFDFAVNAGSEASVRCLQQAVNWCGDPGLPRLICDGKWGPNTVEQVNACGPALVGSFQQSRVAYYDALIAKNPALAIYKDAWTARALK